MGDGGLTVGGQGVHPRAPTEGPPLSSEIVASSEDDAEVEEALEKGDEEASTTTLPLGVSPMSWSAVWSQVPLQFRSWLEGIGLGDMETWANLLPEGDTIDVLITELYRSTAPAGLRDCGDDGWTEFLGYAGLLLVAAQGPHSRRVSQIARMSELDLSTCVGQQTKRRHEDAFAQDLRRLEVASLAQLPTAWTGRRTKRTRTVRLMRLMRTGRLTRQMRTRWGAR